MTSSLADMRRDYTRDGLDEITAPNEPFSLFHQWFAEAVATEQAPIEANAMTLATVDTEGQPQHNCGRPVRQQRPPGQLRPPRSGILHGHGTGCRSGRGPGRAAKKSAPRRALGRHPAAAPGTRRNRARRPGMRHEPGFCGIKTARQRPRSRFRHGACPVRRESRFQ